MNSGIISRRKGNSFSSYQKPVAILLILMAVLSPVYIDQRSSSEEEVEEEPLSVVSLLPVLIVILILAIACSCYLDQSLARFDRYWIHRVGGSTGGLIVVLTVLVFVLKCKASVSGD